MEAADLLSANLNARALNAKAGWILIGCEHFSNLSAGRRFHHSFFCVTIIIAVVCTLLSFNVHSYFLTISLSFEVIILGVKEQLNN